MAAYTIQTKIGLKYGWPPRTTHAETSAKAKYSAYLELGDCYDDFLSYIKDVVSCRKAQTLTAEQASDIRVGDEVRMVNCVEAKLPEGEKTYIVKAGPQMIGGTPCVWLKDYIGCFSCYCLEIVER